jgi:uncharacterized repeat protein (TIGR01451 family)
VKSIIRKSFLLRWLPILVSASVCLFAVFRAGAIIDAALQMQLGNPSGATADPSNHDHYLIQRTVEAIDYSDNLGQPNWVSWDLTAADVGSSGRSDAWASDVSLPPGFNIIPTSTYGSIGSQSYDRGHMCPSADRTDTLAHNELVFIMSNIIPQASAQNQGVWATFESYCRTLLSSQELLIMCGPYNFGPNRLDSGLVGVASNTWKIVVAVPLGAGTALSRITNANPNSIRVIALEIPNTDAAGSSAWTTFITSTRQVQNDTGYNFFSALPNNLAWVLRSKVDGQASPALSSISFSPASGTSGTAVTITGTSLDTVTNVTFNGTIASYTITSPTQIAATVPATTSGTITVQGLGGNATSSSSFTVSSGATSDLAISCTHTGSFTQGDTGDLYTITVTNTGGVASSGTVTVVDMLPAGLTATAISGSGWATDLGSLTGTRSDALAAGATYPPITLTVNVASNAPASVINTATVSGGGDANPANNTAEDFTSINPSGGGGATTTLVGWDVSGLPGGSGNFGPSPLAPTTTAANLTIVAGLTRGTGVGTSGTGAARAWGGNNFVDTSASSAITASRFATFGVAANTGFKVSYSSIARFDYRRSSTGPANGALQCQIGSGAFLDITNLSYSVSTSTGASLGPIDLSGIPVLQNVGAGTNVTFRIVNWGGTTSAGTWYIFDVANTIALDFDLQGTVSPVVAPTPDLALAITHIGSFTQGDTNATYTITVTNIGTAATVGAVSVTDILPAGLTATAIGGNGWDGNPDTLTCTRFDALAVGAGYSPITVTVSVSLTAPASITNTATVSGGGENHFANNTASDPTSIIPLEPIQLWRLQWYGTTADSGASADIAIAANGMPNLLNYALGLNPLVPTNNPVVGDIDTGYLRLTVPRNPSAADISFHVELTGILAPSSWSTNGITVDTDTPALLRVHANAPVASSAGGFMRLRVSRP